MWESTRSEKSPSSETGKNGETRFKEKKSNRFHRQGEIQNPGDTNQNLELGKKSQQA